MKTLLIDKFAMAFELGISPSRVLYFVKNSGLPCVKLSRRTYRFDLKAVKKWQEQLPNLRQTEKQKKAGQNLALRAKERARARKKTGGQASGL